MAYLESIIKVLGIGLLLGAGLPAVFALGLVAYARGEGGDGTDAAVAPNPALKALGVAAFVFVGVVILTAVLWITRATIIHHTGVDLFPFLPKK